MNNYARSLIQCWEGCELEAYKCPAGVWTIGYGRTKGVTGGMNITRDQADIWLDHDLVNFSTAVLKEIGGLKLRSWQIGSLISFTYNVGVYAFQDSTLLKIIKKDPENFHEITEQFMRWRYANKKVIKGLTKRRISEANCYANGRI